MNILKPLENLFVKNSIQAACAIASFIHNGKTDKGGKPYILHPLWVSEQIRQSGGSYEEIIVGLLHDTVEDSELTLKELSEWFSQDIVKAIECISFRCEGFEKETRKEYIKRVRNNRMAKTVKLVDLKHNMDVSRLSFCDDFSDEERIEIHKKLEQYKNEYTYLLNHTIRH